MMEGRKYIKVSLDDYNEFLKYKTDKLKSALDELKDEIKYTQAELTEKKNLLINFKNELFTVIFSKKERMVNKVDTIEELTEVYDDGSVGRWFGFDKKQRDFLYSLGYNVYDLVEYMNDLYNKIKEKENE